MRHIHLYNTFLLESIKGIEYIYKTYYTNISRIDFDEIIQADPTSTPNKMGIYCKWLLGLYKKRNLKIEDLYKATWYLNTFDKFKHLLPVEKRDVNKLKSLAELFDFIEPFTDNKKGIYTNDEERMLFGQFKEVYRDKKYRIIIPLTLKASQYFGQDTQWCTIYPESYSSYTEKQSEEDVTPNNLYILFPLRGITTPRYQFHFEERQFMDTHDKQIDIESFFHINSKIYDFFNSHFPVYKYTDFYLYLKEGDRIDETTQRLCSYIKNKFEKFTITYDYDISRHQKNQYFFDEDSNLMFVYEVKDKFLKFNISNNNSRNITKKPVSHLKFWDTLTNKLGYKDLVSFIKFTVSQFFNIEIRYANNSTNI